MARLAPAFAILPALAFPAIASGADFLPVTDKSAFIDLVDGRELRIGLYDLSLNVTPDGRIAGSALGWEITGTWTWQDGYFCREMDWSGTAIESNCQLVEARGDQELRFTVDRGEGRSARFKLR